MLYKYLNFINENFYDNFKSKYSKLFNESDDEIKKQLDTLFNKIDGETDYLKVVNVFDDFLSSNQQLLNKKITESQGQETINKLLGDNLKTIYFALKSVQVKMNNKDLFIEIFEKSKDKNFQGLMTMKQDKFPDAIPTYVKNYMIPQIEKMAGIQKVQEANVQGVQVQTAQPVQPAQSQQEPEQQKQSEDNKQLETYKTKSEEWFYFIYGMIWDKLKKIKNDMSTNRMETNNIDQLSKLMKNSTNEEAKKQLLTKITALSKEDLNKLGDFLNINKEDVGDF
jgi:hypothetical protein